jgi:hypothetical protein
VHHFFFKKKKNLMGCRKLTKMMMVRPRDSKVMRIGKPLEHLQAALKVTKEMSDPVVGICAMGRQISYAVYLFHDMLIWVRLFSLTTTKSLPLTCPTKQKSDFSDPVCFWGQTK